ncbi:MAG: SH3 domain-containing protein [Saprospiraceae bacterium]|nr:SH3 domain-containing protein [Saprospiraceae bacterium]MDW8484224.1 SH3 domain-containing protein [Saprospiraceae bacterium]
MNRLVYCLLCIHYGLLGFCLALLAGACNGAFDAHSNANLRVYSTTQLRERPEESSSTVQHLPEGTALNDLGEVSPYFTGVYAGDSLLWEPWLRVRTLEGRTGWVFGGFVQPQEADGKDLLRWRHEKRLQALFGRANAQRLLSWHAQQVLTDSALAQHLREGLALRNTLQLALRHGLQRSAPEIRPTLNWLHPYLRYFRLLGHTIALDYNSLAQEVKQTKGEQDDDFVQYCLEIYPLDSMESPLPVWVFPLNVTESVSNLGAGHHWIALQRLDEVYRQAPLFQPELRRIKELLLDDILDSRRIYWQPLPKILAELDRMLQRPPACLSEQERTALTLRRQMFALGRARTNLRSGR